jgi:hypothetical protein
MFSIKISVMADRFFSWQCLRIWRGCNWNSQKSVGFKSRILDSDLLTECMWQAVQNGAAAVVAVGGDGTLNEVIALWIWKYRPYIWILSSLLTLFDHIQTILNHFEGSYKNLKKSCILLCEAKVFEMLECTGMASSTAWLDSCMTWTFSSST